MLVTSYGAATDFARGPAGRFCDCAVNDAPFLWILARMCCTSLPPATGASAARQPAIAERELVRITTPPAPVETIAAALVKVLDNDNRDPRYWTLDRNIVICDHSLEQAIRRPIGDLCG